MRCRYLIPILAMGLALGTAVAAQTAASASSSPAAGPWTVEYDASPAFSPDGDAVVFARGHGPTRRLYMAHRRDGSWSAAEQVPISNRWMDLEPAMAPDGSSLVFVSNRPASGTGQPLDGSWGGQAYPGRGGNLWRVQRNGTVWSSPARLPDTVNASTSTFSPAVAADGSVYFMRADPASGAFRLWRSRFVQGNYAAAQPLALGGGKAHSDYDPAVAPDRSFLVFSSDRPPASPSGDDLFIAYATPQGWSTPLDLGIVGNEARLSAERTTLYYSAPDHRIHCISLAPWLAARPAN